MYSGTRFCVPDCHAFSRNWASRGHERTNRPGICLRIATFFGHATPVWAARCTMTATASMQRGVTFTSSSAQGGQGGDYTFVGG
jgi:hypothetical protein